MCDRLGNHMTMRSSKLGAYLEKVGLHTFMVFRVSTVRVTFFDLECTVWKGRATALKNLTWWGTGRSGGGGGG